MKITQTNRFSSPRGRYSWLLATSDTNFFELLVQTVLQNAGALSNNRRKQLIAKGHPQAIIDQAVVIVAGVLASELSQG